MAASQAGTIHVFKVVSQQDKYQSLKNPKSLIGMAAEMIMGDSEICPANEWSLAQIRLPKPFEEHS